MTVPLFSESGQLSSSFLGPVDSSLERRGEGRSGEGKEEAAGGGRGMDFCFLGHLLFCFPFRLFPLLFPCAAN